MGISVSDLCPSQNVDTALQPTWANLPECHVMGRWRPSHHMKPPPRRQLHIQSSLLSQSSGCNLLEHLISMFKVLGSIPGPLINTNTQTITFAKTCPQVSNGVRPHWQSALDPKLILGFRISLSAIFVTLFQKCPQNLAPPEWRPLKWVLLTSAKCSSWEPLCQLHWSRWTPERPTLSKTEPAKWSELNPDGAPTSRTLGLLGGGGYELLLPQLPALHEATKQA